MKKLPYINEISVAAHRGYSEFYPENTMLAFRKAVECKPDMIETDVHMTKDGVMIIMHDHDVRRTTNGTGLIREKTLAEMKELDAGYWKDEKYRGEKVPTFVEFLEYVAPMKDLMFNIELKDYPADSGAFAYEACDKTIALMDQYGITERSCINSWSGELNEYIAEKYGDRIRIHGYDNFSMGRNQKRLVLDYAYCVCLFGTPNELVVPESKFRFVKDYGVEPWVFYKIYDEDTYMTAVRRGARLFTANDPVWVMNFLRSKGLHK